MSDFTGPSVGRIVHFCATRPGGYQEPLPAIIVSVSDDGVCLNVFTPDGVRVESKVKGLGDERGENRWWIWPPRT